MRYLYMLGISSRKRLMNKTTGNNVQRWPLGLIFSSSIALLAYRRRSLNKSGVVGAIASGTAIFSAGGWSWGIALIYFFVSSSLLSHYRERDMARVTADKLSKVSNRATFNVAYIGCVAAHMAVTSVHKTV